MMQEAKSSCAGQWYLPAGRIEAGENILVCEERRCLILKNSIVHTSADNFFLRFRFLRINRSVKLV